MNKRKTDGAILSLPKLKGRITSAFLGPLPTADDLRRTGSMKVSNYNNSHKALSRSSTGLLSKEGFRDPIVKKESKILNLILDKELKEMLLKLAPEARKA